MAGRIPSASTVQSQPDPERETARAGTVILNERITPAASPEDVRHIELEVAECPVFLPGQSLEVLVPGPHEFGNEHHRRLYTLSGAEPVADTNLTHLHLCVRRCRYIDEYSGEAYQAVASNYLCDRVPGDRVQLRGPYGTPFELPTSPSAGLLLIGLGTGIAPFRHFVRHVYSTTRGWKGPVRLFFGARSGQELLYMNEHRDDFARYSEEETFRAIESLSPRPHLDHPPALSESLLAHQTEILAMLDDPDTRVYVAGLASIHGELDEAFIRMLGSETRWGRRLAELKAGGRWVELLY